MIINEEMVTTHTKTFTDKSSRYNGITIDINKLIKLAKPIKAQYLAFSRIIVPDKARNKGFSPKRLNKANIQYPILVTPVGDKYMIVDGRHRYWKAKESRRDKMRVKVVTPQHIHNSVVNLADVRKQSGGKGNFDGARREENMQHAALGAASAIIVMKAVKPIVKSLIKYYRVKYSRHRIDLKAYKIMVHNSIRRALVGAAKYSNTVQFYNIQNHVILTLYANINKAIQDNKRFNNALYNSLEFFVDFAIENKPITTSDIISMTKQLKSLSESARNYKKEYDEYHSKPEQRKNRSNRVLARRKLAKQGRVTKGDGKDVDHKDGNPQNNSNGNLRVLSKKSNRGSVRVKKEGIESVDKMRLSSQNVLEDLPNGVYLVRRRLTLTGATPLPEFAKKISRKLFNHYALIDIGNNITTGPSRDNVIEYKPNVHPPVPIIRPVSTDGSWVVIGRVRPENYDIVKNRIEIAFKNKYNLFRNNCEHLMNFIATGRSYSGQVYKALTGVATATMGVLVGIKMLASLRKKKKNVITKMGVDHE